MSKEMKDFLITLGMSVFTIAIIYGVASLVIWMRTK